MSSKKRAREEDDNSFEDETEDNVMELDEGVEEIPVDFVFSDPKELDFKTIKTFMMQYLEGKAWNATELADLVIAQKFVGSIIKVEGDDEGFGFISVINLNQHKDRGSIKEIVSFIKTKISKHGTKEQVQRWYKLLDEPGVGLILNERMLNIPPQLAPHLHKCLYEEIQWAIEDEAPFKFTNYIMLTSYYQEGVTTAKKKVKQNEEFMFYKPEDEVYKKHASDTVYYKLVANEQQSRWTLDKMAREYRLLLLIDAAKSPTILKEINELISTFLNSFK